MATRIFVTRGPDRAPCRCLAFTSPTLQTLPHGDDRYNTHGIGLQPTEQTPSHNGNCFLCTLGFTYNWPRDRAIPHPVRDGTIRLAARCLREVLILQADVFVAVFVIPLEPLTLPALAPERVPAPGRGAPAIAHGHVRA